MKDYSKIRSTKEVKVAPKLAEQIIGQEQALKLITKAAKQRRNVFLIGSPGTGKSMLGQALAELLPKEKLVDIIALPNPTDENTPLIRTVPKGKAKDLIAKAKLKSTISFRNQTWLMLIFLIITSFIPYYLWKSKQISDIIYAASMITGMIFILGFILFINLSKRTRQTFTQMPKLLVDNSNATKVPFLDGTGAHAGALLGDCLHDPLQSGGLGTPPHERLVVGMIHRANGGVLFIDEIEKLRIESQQELLTVIQEKKLPITGQSERSSGAMVRSEPAPCFPKEVGIVTEKGEVRIGQFIDNLLNQNKDKIIQQDNLEILNLNNKAYQAYSWKNNKIIKDDIMALSRRKFKGKLIEMEFDDGTRIISTPDHPIKIKDGFIEAKKLKIGDNVESAEFMLLNENSMIRTYSKENQRIAKAFLTWQNQYNINKNILYYKSLGVDAKTEYSWKKGAIPHALKPVYFLKNKKLIPLNLYNKKTTTISRVCGALLGDGGISQNLKRIYFSTDKKSIKDLLDFKKDILSIFGNTIENNIKIRKHSNDKGEGLEISINYAFIARFFYSLGIPKGDKVAQPIKIPEWINFNDECKSEFFSTLLECELYAKLSKGSIKDNPHFSMSKIKEYEKEHILFLNELKSFLNLKGIKTLGITKGRVYLKSKNLKQTVECARYILKLSSDYENLKKLYSIPWNYAIYKRQEIKKLLERGIPYLKHKKHCLEAYPKAINLVKNGFTIKKAAKLLNVSHHTLWCKVPPIYKSYTIEDRNKVKNFLKEGKLPKEISNQLNIPYTTVLSWRKKCLI